MTKDGQQRRHLCAAFKNVNKEECQASERTKGGLKVTPDANRANDLHVKSMQRRERQSCGAIRANEAARIERFFRANRAS